MKATIEVVTATYDRAEPLKRMLSALSQQRFRKFSVAVVDDCSTQPAVDALATLELNYDVRHLRTLRNGGPAAARNLAVRTSNADLIIFIDDDVVPDEGLVESHVTTQTAGPGLLTVGPLLAPSDWRATPWNSWEAATLAVEYEKMERGVYRPTWRQFFTGNASVWRSDFLAVGGFDESFARAEDIEFAYRLARRGARFSFLPEAIGWHYAHRSLASWRRIPGQYAEFDLTIDRLHPELGWDGLVQREATRRHLVTRSVGKAVSVIGAEALTSACFIGAGRMVFAAGVHPLSHRLFSLAYQLEYGKKRRELLARPPFNSPSTVAE